jgi:hypothetical protein
MVWSRWSSPWLSARAQTLRDQLIEQIYGIVLCHGFEYVSEGHQGGDAAFLRHTRNGLRPRRCGIPRQSGHAPRRDSGEVELPSFQSLYFGEPVQGLDHCGRTDARGCAAQSIERGKACPIGHD